jgi:hypothetical protein
MRTLLLGAAYFTAVFAGVLLLSPAITVSLPRCPDPPATYFVFGVVLALLAVLFFALAPSGAGGG